MNITWEVEDNYIGKSRPQFTYVDDDDLAACETDDEREVMIASAIQDDFEMNISWSEICRGNMLPTLKTRRW